MANLEQAFQDVVIPLEGVYSKDSSDLGGETAFGLTRKYDSDWDGWQLVAKYKLLPNFPSNLNNPEVIKSALEYYRKNYWDKMYLSDVNSQKIATELFDSGINLGMSTAGKFVQRAVNVLNKKGTLWPDITVDGMIGPKTVSAVNAAPEDRLFITLNCLQGSRYVEICEANPSQEVFFNGWIKRSKTC